MDLDCIQRCQEVAVYQEIFNSLETAVLYYDDAGELRHANIMAQKVLPDIWHKLSRLKEFIRFVFEYSLDVDDQNQLWALTSVSGQKTIFHELVKLDNLSYYDVRAMDHGGSVIVEILDISQIKSTSDDIAVLGIDKLILTEAMETSSKGIFIAKIDTEKRIVFANKAVDQLLCRSNASLVGYDVDAFLSSEFPFDENDIRKVIKEKSKGNFWKRIDQKDGRSNWLRLNLSAEKNYNGIYLVIGFISDETQNKIRENQLLQTQKLEAIGKLAGGVAHDFNNILSIVEGYIRLSETALKRGENVSGNFEKIKQAVLRGSGLTRQLLLFGKHRVVDGMVIDLCRNLRDIENLLQPLLGVNIRLDVDAPKEVLPIKATADSLSQIIMNLVLNARDAMPDGGDIKVSAYQQENNDRKFVVMSIADTGHGMDRLTMNKIFDPFFTTKEQGKGTGLGLSMVYGLVQQFGGTIDVESVVGKGTIFTIRIPLADGDFNDDVFKTSATEAEISISGKTILLAEDEPDLLDIMESTLKELGLKVLKALNGNEALAIQDEFEGRIDYLLTDMVMPELGGLKLAELMKEVRPETHIVFMSGYPVRGEIANISLPRDAIFMAKPVKPDFLRTVLKDLSAGQDVQSGEAMVWQAE